MTTKDLLTPKYPARLVEQVTGISLVTQRNWIAREQYAVTEIAPYLEEPIAGRERMWPLVGVYENEGRALSIARSIDPLIFSKAFYMRMEQEGMPALIKKHGGPTIAYFETEMIALAVQQMTEFATGAPDRPFFWVVECNGDRQVKNVQVARGDTVLRDLHISGSCVFNITQIVASVDAKVQDE